MRDSLSLLTLRDDIDAFDLVERQGAGPSAPESRSNPASAIEDSATETPGRASSAGRIASLEDARLAQMIQNMASFSARAGECDRMDRGTRTQDRYEYFAA